VKCHCKPTLFGQMHCPFQRSKRENYVCMCVRERDSECVWVCVFSRWVSTDRVYGSRQRLFWWNPTRDREWDIAHSLSHSHEMSYSTLPLPLHSKKLLLNIWCVKLKRFMNNYNGVSISTWNFNVNCYYFNINLYVQNNWKQLKFCKKFLYF